MRIVSAADFAKNFDRYSQAAQREPVAIASEVRIAGYYVSKHEFDELQRLRVFGRRVYAIGTCHPRSPAPSRRRPWMRPMTTSMH